MIVTVRVAMEGSSRKPLVGTIEVKGPCHTGDLVTLITGCVGKVIDTTTMGYIKVEAAPSVYEHCRKNLKWKEAY
ncbi:MAG: hypothetical protein KBD06_02090 [Candidatus Pacebacteria bacterium]|nr:hypothetical protein [Candidatus Paceibacterota bacterium]